MGLTVHQVKSLKHLARCKHAKKRTHLLREGGAPMQKTLRECAHNLLKGTVPLTPRQRKDLKKHASGIRSLAKKKTSLKSRLAVEQKGGFLLGLLGPIFASLAGGALSSILSRKKK